MWHEQKEYAPYLYSGNGTDGKEPGTAGVHVRIPRNRDGRGQADQRKNDLPAYGRSDAWGKKGETDMGYQDDYVMRTISDLVRAIARLALGKNEINYALPDTEDKYSDTDRIYRKLRDLVDAGEINEAENQLYENLDENDTEHLEMALTFYMYLNQLDDDTLFMANYSREEIVEGINSVSASFGITGFENFVDTTMV